MAKTTEVLKLDERANVNKLKAIRAHEGFLRFVISEVNKIGVKEVLTDDAHKNLRSLYQRVLKFAEDVQLKMVVQTQKVQGDAESPLRITAYLPRMGDGNE